MAEYTVVGLPYYDFNIASRKLKLENEVLRLEWDEHNLHSNTAIAVFVDSANSLEKMYKLGYISGRESTVLFKLLNLDTTDDIIIAKLVEARPTCLKIELVNKPAEPKFSNQAYRDELLDIARYAQYTIRDTQVKNPFNEKPKEKTMFEKIVNTNATLAQSAAFLEAGRIANNTASKFVASKAPLMVRGYVDTAFGKLLIANAAAVAAEKFRPGDKKLAKLANAMITQAYQEVYQIVDIEKMLNEMLTSESVKSAFAKLESSDGYES